MTTIKDLQTRIDEIKSRIEEKLSPTHSNVFLINDGIIEIEKYSKAKIKILWILKEPNSSEGGWSYQDYLTINTIEGKIGTNKNTLSYKIFQKILYASYGILNDFPCYSQMPSITEKKVYEVGEQIAYINIKKTGGGSKSQDSDISNAYRDNKEILMSQIAAYNPNVLIFGNTLGFFDKSDLKKIGWDLNNTEGVYVNDNTKNTTCYQISQDRLIIHAYHPAYWVISNDVYCTEIVEGVKLWRSQFEIAK